MDNEVGLTHLRLASGFCVLGGNRVGTCQNEKNTDLEERERKSKEHPQSSQFLQLFAEKDFALMF